MTTATRAAYWRKDGPDSLVRGDYRITRVGGGDAPYTWIVAHRGVTIGAETRLRYAKTLAAQHEGETPDAP